MVMRSLKMRVNVDNRARVRLLRKHHVVRHTEHQHRACHNDSVVHLIERCMVRRRPATEEDDEKQVANSNNIVRDAKCAFEFPRAPGQAAVVGLVDLSGLEDSHGGVGIVEVAAESAPEEQADGEQVGEVEALQDHGDCAVEGGGVDDVDQG